MEPEQIISDIAGRIKEYLSNHKQGRFLQYKDPNELQKILRARKLHEWAIKKAVPDVIKGPISKLQKKHRKIFTCI
jgi:hypothetical protein